MIKATSQVRNICCVSDLLLFLRPSSQSSETDCATVAPLSVATMIRRQKGAVLRHRPLLIASDLRAILKFLRPVLPPGMIR
ncbi:uncharacterized protein BDW43DRAFT_274566 [Aspergillus alliaceus]|uniref:uncharacterized protein n=1 Tax=Petromyces alliaceus TaxID=209559 RepID=UPI0012A5089D|nr:uncharacterized protein BDW43DRAFT_274566 [Aspergillus alliaceus]KAB8234226.1 hypothetical protein BDW43DRAFT_274566 [Aspergillus alliaceus]